MRSSPAALGFAVTIAVLVLVEAGCGSAGNQVAQLGTVTTTASQTSSSGNSSGASAQTKAVVYSRCMRSNGVLTYPDPNSSGGTDKSKVTAARTAAGAAKFAAALNACKHLLPPSPSGPSPADVQQVMNGMTRFAQCMRSHGVSDWPDPSRDVGRPTFDINSIDYQTRRASTAIRECQHLMPGSIAPRICSALLAQQNGDPAGDERCFGGA